mgnify:FL=1
MTPSDPIEREDLPPAVREIYDRHLQQGGRLSFREHGIYCDGQLTAGELMTIAYFYQQRISCSRS